MSLIHCHDLTLSYDGRPVIEGLTFEVERGDCLCIVGENGAGKSTLMKALLGLKTPAAGHINLAPRLHGVGYLPQRTDAQKDFPASVWEVVLSGRLSYHRFLPFYTAEDRRIAEEKLSRLGISALKRRSFAELSGGQQQRVLLARALAAAEELLLLDEPVAGLDPTATADFYTILEHMREEGMTILMVSHDLTSSLRCATKLLWLRHGGHRLLTPEQFRDELPQLLLGGEAL